MPKKDEQKGTVRLEHVLLPYHELLSDAEAAEVLKKLNVTPDKLPKIKKTDPGLRAHNINAKRGDIIRIHRKDPTGTYYYYRLVV